MSSQGVAVSQESKGIVVRLKGGWLVDFASTVNSQYREHSLIEACCSNLPRTPYIRSHEPCHHSKKKRRLAEIIEDGRNWARESFQRLVASAEAATYFALADEKATSDIIPRVNDSRTGGVDVLPLLHIATTIMKSGTLDEGLQGLNSIRRSPDYPPETRYSGRKDWLLNILGTEFVCPPNSTFLCSDISELHQFSAKGECPPEGYDCIVMDPPWNNKSVRRSSKYESISLGHLSHMDIGSISAPGGYVFVWVTNNPKIQNFVKTEMFPKWGLEYYTEWVWIKCTTQAELVIPWESTHRKTYEPILIGRKPGSTFSGLGTLPHEQVIVSIPVEHSRKPPLSAIIHDCLTTSRQDTESDPEHSQPRCLELFARNLQEGWTSWGNEVLKFQAANLFQSHSPPPK